MLRNHPIRIMVLLALACLLGAAGWVGGRRFMAERHFRSAQAAADQRDFAKAIKHLAVCLETMPDSGQVHFLAARTARRARAFDLATEHLIACGQLGYEPSSVELEWMLLGAQRGRFAEQEPSLRDLVAQGHPDTAMILEVLIDGYIQHFNMISAVRCLDTYLEREPNNFQAWLGRGYVCERLFHWTNAVKAYHRAVELRPEDYQARLRLAKALFILGPPNEAAEEFERLRRMRPDDAEVLLGLARCRRQQDRLEEAGQLLDELTALHPANDAALLERGRMAMASADPKGAEGWLRKAVDRSPCDRETRYSLYQCLQQQNKQKEAQECLAAFERLDADLKRIDVLTNQMQKMPYNPLLYHEAGVLFLRNGSEEEGVRWLHLALHYDPFHKPSHEALADFYESVGKPESAARHRQMAQQDGER